MKQSECKRQEQLLTELMSRHDKARPSVQSDQTVLDAAQAHASRQTKVRKTFAEWLLAPVGVASNALASIAVTATVFFAMAQAILLPQPSFELEDQEVMPEAVQQQMANVSPTRTEKTKSERPKFEVYQPDQVLLEISLPNVADLIRSMEFVAEAERADATIELIMALADIEILIGAGQLNQARDRYLDLRERCYACQLPVSLEALALSELNARGRG